MIMTITGKNIFNFIMISGIIWNIIAIFLSVLNNKNFNNRIGYLVIVTIIYLYVNGYFNKYIN